MANFYIDGTTLNNATAVYDDAALTICATAGFYSDGITSREQVFNGSNCYLLPPQPCPTCATPCGTQINGNGAQGVYQLDMDVGGTASDVGAIVIRFNPIGVPDGIMAVYDGVVYNTVSSPQFGLLESTVQGVPTYIGSTGSDCGTAGGGTYPNLPVFQYIGNQFVNTNQPTTIQIQAGQSQLTAGQPGDCVMVIPKPNASPAIINFTFIGPCNSTAWNFNVQCPTTLNQIISTSPQSTSSAACTAELNSAIHHVPVVGSAQNQIQVNDYIFVDHDGATPATAGWYGSPFGYTYEVGPRGVVINKQTSCNHITVQDCTNQNLYTMNDRFGTNSVGEVIQYKRINQTTFQIESQVYCGTITNMGSGTFTNAVQEGFIDYDCADTVHCP
jgi:hypothetical protein